MSVELADVDVKTKKTIAVVGLPNTGKSLIFNHLTGEYTVVANYPLTTVEIKQTECHIKDVPYNVIDTPGLHCLSIHSEEELAIRNMLFSEQPDVIIQCIDANQLKQSLALTADLSELATPMVISLNAIDETSRKGIWIDSSELSNLLGVSVIETIATQGRGIDELRDAVMNAKTPLRPVRYGDTIEEAVADLQDILPDGAAYSRKVALLMCMGDPFIERHVARLAGEESVRELSARVKKLGVRFMGDVVTAVTKKRGRWVDEIAEKTVKRQKVSSSQFGKTFGHLSRHPVSGIPILGLFLMATYYLVVHVAGTMEGLLDAYLAGPVVEFVSDVIPPGFWNELVVSEDYGLLTMGLFNAICTVLPILSVFFVMFGLMEDIGYIPNLCVLTKRMFEKVGLSGKAVMSLVLGFGCKTMATLTTVGLPRKEKAIAIYLIAFCIPCSAQMALSMGLLGRYALWAFLITYAALVLVEILAGIVLNRIIPEEGATHFIQELPPMRLPNPKAVLIKTYYRLYWFLKEAVPIFLMAALALFLIDKIGVLDVVKAAARPIVVNWLGLPLDVVDALILCLARHEAAAAMLIKMTDAGKLDITQCMVAVFITTMFVPCFANIVAMCKRVGVKTGLLMTFAINISAFILAGTFYWTLVFFRGTFA
ncbi:ferrous iron transport protein B [Candidatus Hydrogenedentota bacterium]